MAFGDSLLAAHRKFLGSDSAELQQHQNGGKQPERTSHQFRCPRKSPDLPGLLRLLAKTPRRSLDPRLEIGDSRLLTIVPNIGCELPVISVSARLQRLPSRQRLTIRHGLRDQEVWVLMLG
jgi:hypothetical protein